MKITEKSAEGNDDNDYRSRYKVEVITDNSHLSLSFSDGEPEDATLSRDYNDVYSIVDVAKAAYNAGVRGEDLEVTKEELGEDEW